MDAVRHPLRKIKSENNGDSEQISTHNFILGERICRLCLGAKANTNIFEMESEMVAKILLNLIVCCDLEISENDGLPKHICPSCLDTLEIASNFRTMCQENDKTLRTKYLTIPIVKDEFFSDNDIPDAISDNEFIKDEIDIKDTEYFIDVKTTKRKHKTKLKRKTKEIKIKKEIIEKPVKRKSVHDNSHLCTICGKYFEKRSTYHSHLRSHTNEVFHCNECQKTFNRKTKLQEHMITHFGIKNIPCDECGKLFASRAYVQRHVDKVHKRLRVVQCTICLKQLADNHTLKYHMKTHTGEKDYVCPLCHKQFTFKLSLQYHLRTHSGERPYPCRYCHKRFSDSKSSADHEMLHTGETPYKCPICAKGFAQLSNMKSHFRYNHKGQDIKDYPSYKKRNNRNNEVFVPKEIVPIVR